jgi:hypothetical protein
MESFVQMILTLMVVKSYAMKMKFYVQQKWIFLDAKKKENVSKRKEITKEMFVQSPQFAQPFVNQMRSLVQEDLTRQDVRSLIFA